MLCPVLMVAQTHVQNVKGAVLDQDSKMPLIGANIMIRTVDKTYGASTDLEGYFKIEGVPVGRHDIEISYLGYEPRHLKAVLLTSGKELNLQIELAESTVQLATAEVVAKTDRERALNEMATVSARAFSVEETSRYAASLNDPARMAQNFAGVTISGGQSDLFNEIIVRGNSPRGVMWRLEGIEIPNPNHFGGMGNSGGAISMLSSSTLSNSDFYTGAFPSEFGNAISGVFDLNMRNGNAEKREYAFMLGALGIEAALEGPLREGSRASYLINYRYSTLAALASIGLNPAGDVLPEYQDLSFKVNVPTKHAGTFGLFGLGGKNRAFFEPTADSTAWESSDDKSGFEEAQEVGTIGLSHRLILTDRSYLRTVATASYEGYTADSYFLEPEEDYKVQSDGLAEFANTTYRISSTYTHKLNARNTFRGGMIFSHMAFDFSSRFNEDDVWRTYLQSEGDASLLQAFVHWKHRFNEKLTLNSGLHYTHFMLNDRKAIEPRVAMEWQLNDRQRISGAIGIHSKPEHVSFYYTEKSENGDTRTTPNRDLDMIKAMHAVLGYDQRLGTNLRLKAEVYYQHLYDVPVEAEPGSVGSILNSRDVWDLSGEIAVNEGTGRNYGIDLTLEKFFDQQYYFLLTTSVFDSRYTTVDGKRYSTRFNSNYQVNLLGGKEFKVGKKRNNIIGLNGKVLFAGGNRQTPTDLIASREKGEAVLIDSETFSEKTKAYFRLDFGVNYRINKRRMTHTISIDIQNITNRENLFGTFYDEDTGQLETYTQTGLFPNFNYRVEF